MNARVKLALKQGKKKARPWDEVKAELGLV
jgi:hypothetical protein